MLALGIAGAVVYWVLEAFVHAFVLDDGTMLAHLVPGDRHELWMRLCVCGMFVCLGIAGNVLIARLRAAQQRQAQLASELEHALTRMISGFMPICAACKSVRDDDRWTPVEAYVTTHTDMTFSHTVCPSCAKQLYPNLTP